MEIWKSITNYENYEVSNEGRIRSKDHIQKSGLINQEFTLKKGVILKPVINKNKDFRITLYDKNHKSKIFSLHRLIAFTFLGEPKENKMQVNHINGKRCDNRLINLEWVTKKENAKHSQMLKLQKGRCRKPIKCINNGLMFESTYEAAEWVCWYKNYTNKNIRNMADKIRCCGKQIQLTAYGFKWEYIDSCCSETSVVKRVHSSEWK